MLITEFSNYSVKYTRDQSRSYEQSHGVFGRERERARERDLIPTTSARVPVFPIPLHRCGATPSGVRCNARTIATNRRGDHCRERRQKRSRLGSQTWDFPDRIFSLPFFLSLSLSISLCPLLPLFLSTSFSSFLTLYLSYNPQTSASSVIILYYLTFHFISFYKDKRFFTVYNFRRSFRKRKKKMYGVLNVSCSLLFAPSHRFSSFCERDGRCSRRLARAFPARSEKNPP